MQFQYEKLKKFRNDHGLTLRDLSKKTGVTFQNISNIENGSDPKIKTVIKLAKGMGVDINWFFIK